MSINESGLEVERTEYYPYGKVQSGGFEKYGFTGQENDADTELMYYGARYYSPEYRVFVQPDKMLPDPYNPQYLNRYAYTLNNPVKYTDPSGHAIQAAPLLAAALLVASTVLDFAMFSYSVEAYEENPNAINGAFLAYDSVATIAPHLPASWVVRGPKLIQYIRTYEKTIKGLDPLTYMLYRMHEFGAKQGLNFAANSIIGGVIESRSNNIDNFFQETFDTNAFDHVELSGHSKVYISVSNKWVPSIRDNDGYYIIGVN
ncbi:RHS repeat-associated core domain-containing protein [Methanolobus sp. ZRKC2]|uniref:RHS repeat-associated core domain-containing protein n=1 Tax=Methanolobus sp. ZRKC2 TaxID=3125783 RepID=UPI00324BE132